MTEKQLIRADKQVFIRIFIVTVGALLSILGFKISGELVLWEAGIAICALSLIVEIFAYFKFKGTKQCGIVMVLSFLAMSYATVICTNFIIYYMTGVIVMLISMAYMNVKLTLFCGYSSTTLAIVKSVILIKNNLVSVREVGTTVFVLFFMLMAIMCVTRLRAVFAKEDLDAVTDNIQMKMEAVKKKAELADELLKAKEEAETANRAKSDFLAKMSHEIRTPINAVLGIDEMILRECNDPQILDYAAKIKSSGQSLLYLINDILDLSKIESNKMEITPSEYEPKKLVSEVLLMIEPHADAKGLTLHCDIDPRIPRKLYGDDMRIRQILLNLLSNAVKYTSEGKITFSVQLLQKADTDVILHFSVKDTGIGIKEEDRKLLFESFRRFDIAHNKRIEGTGLGLNITRKLLQLMDSDLCLQSIYEIGSDFNFDMKQQIVDAQEMGRFPKGLYLPVATATYREGFCAPDAKILVVDDNDMNLTVFKGLIQNSQMDIRTAMSGQEAIDLIQKEAFDLVFMDHLMPMMDGIETLHRILADANLRSHAKIIIALTANAVSGAKEFYLQEGFSGYLTKPIHGHELEETILEFLPQEKVHALVKGTLTSEEAAIVKSPKEAVPSMDPQNNESISVVLDQKLGISLCAGDKTFYHEVLKAFVQSDFSAMLNGYFTEKDWKGYHIAIHGVKSGAKSIGATALSELAKDMELALKERNDTEFIVSKHPIVLCEIEKVEKLIHEIVRK